MDLSIIVDLEKAKSPINNIFYDEVLKNYTVDPTGRIETVKSDIALQKIVAKNNHNKTEVKNGRSLIETLQQNEVFSLDRIINYYVTEKKKKAIVIINALGLSINLWESLITMMKPYYQIVVWETRCGSIEHGGMEGVISIDEHAGDIDAIIKAEKLEAVNIIAWCNGTRIGVKATSMNSNVKSLILIAPSFRGIQGVTACDTQFEQQLDNLFVQVKKKPQNAGVLASFFGKMITRKVALETLSESDILGYNNDTIKAQVFVPMTKADYLINYGQRTEVDELYDIGALIEKIDQKTLFILGENDAVVSNGFIEEVAEKFDDTDILSIKGGSHYMHIQNTNLVKDIIFAFLNNTNEYELLSNRITFLNYDNFII